MPAMPFCTFDDSLWPLLRLRVVGEASKPQFEEYLKVSGSYFHRGEPHVVISDLLHVGMISAELRRRQAEWTALHEGIIRRTLLGNAFVLNKAPFFRLGLNILLHLNPPSWPYVVVSDMEPALAWAVVRLEDAGLREPAERIRRHFGLRLVSRSG
ncbi:hypothetical protein BO221_27525 [Archangium sp. Cb G35]|uniref:hypothetical protein n=1 Tax=Archangium sp. Cb G35 TaxID=1920190 RepID=UPI0009372DBF|nr:hypothetical protein [Archangium sp. Cb G35]OJT21562.1 hypothetical protein BO221_27525 [Archangium sp. Cb G35]